MKISLLFVVMLLSSTIAKAQFVAKMEVKGDIPGICNKDEVYSMIPSFKGQEEAIPPITIDEILERLNSEVKILKSYSKQKKHFIVSLIINCKGELVQVNSETEIEELNVQIEKVFTSLGAWKAGKLNGKEIDTSKLFSLKIKKGKFIYG